MPSDGIGVASSVSWPPADPSSAASGATSSPHFWANGSFSFRDLLDTINPLEHLPVVSTIYGWITGKHDIGDLPRIAGDALYGGPWGALSGLVNALVKEESGQDIGEHVVATLTGAISTTTAVAASAEPQPASASPPDSATTQASLASGPPAGVPNNPLATGPSSATAAATSGAATAPATSGVIPSTPVLPDHPPMPLVRNAVPPIAGTQSPVSTNADAASKAFLAQTEQRERQLYRSTGTPTDNGRVLNSQPVPLMVPPGALPNGGRPRLMPASVAVPSVNTTTAPPDPNSPVDISQKMLDALDKYTALQEQQNASAGRGSQVNITP